MSSASAAVSALLPRSRRLHHRSPAASATSPCTLPFRRRRRRLTTAYAVLSRDDWAAVPVSAIGPANADNSIFKVTLDLSDAPELASSYTTPGQLVQASVPSSGLRPAYMEISSAPGAQQLDLLARSVPGTTTERLCTLGVRDHVELGAITGQGLPVQSIKEAETVLYLAVAEGLSPIRALIKSGLTNNVSLYYGARNQEAVPLQVGEFPLCDVCKSCIH
ncbi:hypothetical protein SETIT_2G017600v2 [Setaria italica]|uniref:FAD-binding FR-type domain-containing protein n=1 Tax=Setaria italica TaxID=4555 RepID=A0A368PU49_SETIT|nr:hypothetical protein SETIT_2G017600v2 [Setaria italica]